MTRLLQATVLTAFGLAIPGCLIVATDRHHHASKAQLSDTREVEPGCPPSFRNEHHDRLAQLGPSTTVEDFKRLFPGAVFVEQSSHDGRATEVYSVHETIDYHFRGDNEVISTTHHARFYFADGRLVKWSEE
jgi:hypothetical protein